MSEPLRAGAWQRVPEGVASDPLITGLASIAGQRTEKEQGVGPTNLCCVTLDSPAGVPLIDSEMLR